MMIALAALLVPLAFAGTANARSTVVQCKKEFNKCTANCNRYTDGPFKDSCNNRCRSKLNTCVFEADTPGKVGTPPDPLNPKGTGNNTPPTGGTKAEPKAPPKVNDTRPPMGGGVFQPRTSGGGNDGPISLHSGGSPGPILKSNSGNGPSPRSGGRN